MIDAKVTIDANNVELPPAIVEALRATFRTAHPEAITLLRGGLSRARVYHVRVAEQSYVLRHLESSESDPIAQRSASQREYRCMSIAAEQGIAPRVHYANPESGVSISDFIEGPTLGEKLRSDATSAVRLLEPLASILRTLHRSPAFPPFTTVADACIAVGGALQARGVTIPHGNAFFDRIAEMRAALAPHVTIAPCHHDLNPGNIIVDSDERLWLIDWSGACSGDPMHDVVTQSVFVYRTPEAHAKWLRAYLGREPTEIETARAIVSRAQALTFFGVLLLASAVNPSSGTVDATSFGADLAAAAEREAGSAEYGWALKVLGG